MPVSKTESATRDLLSHFLPFLQAQYNTRPAWLINPETGRRLELDIFFPEIGVAIEVQGQQHDRPTTWADEASEYQEYAAQKGFEAQLRRDNHKLVLCGEHHIVLLHVRAADLTEGRFKQLLAQILSFGHQHTAPGCPYQNPGLHRQFERARYDLTRRVVSDAYASVIFKRADGYTRRVPASPKAYKPKVSLWRRLLRLLAG